MLKHWMTRNDVQILWHRPCLPFSVIRDVFRSSSGWGNVVAWCLVIVPGSSRRLLLGTRMSNLHYILYRIFFVSARVLERSVGLPDYNVLVPDTQYKDELNC